jgi:hypothetical protein
MNSIRKTAIVVGVFFILAAVTSIIALALYGSILNDPNYIFKSDTNHNPAMWGAFLEIILAFCVIGTSVSLFPVLKKYNESMAIGAVAFRILEAAILVIGIICLLTIVTLNQEATKNTESILTASKLLVAIHNWTFLFGPNFALGPSTLLTSYLLYQSKLVPRVIAILGLIGGPLIFASATLVLFGFFPQISVWGTIFALPVFAYEMSLAIWLIVKGFNVSSIHEHRFMEPS